MTKKNEELGYEVSKMKIACVDLGLLGIVFLVVIFLVYASSGINEIIGAIRFSFWTFFLLLMFGVPGFNIFFFLRISYFHTMVIEFAGVSSDPYTICFVWFVTILYATIGYTLTIASILSFGYFLGHNESKIANIINRLALVKQSTIEKYNKR